MKFSCYSLVLLNTTVSVNLLQFVTEARDEENGGKRKIKKKNKKKNKMKICVLKLASVSQYVRVVFDLCETLQSYFFRPPPVGGRQFVEETV